MGILTLNTMDEPLFCTTTATTKKILSRRINIQQFQSLHHISPAWDLSYKNLGANFMWLAPINNHLNFVRLSQGLATSILDIN